VEKKTEDWRETGLGVGEKGKYLGGGGRGLGEKCIRAGIKNPCNPWSARVVVKHHQLTFGHITKNTVVA